jgi:hypothetical protein
VVGHLIWRLLRLDKLKAECPHYLEGSLLKIDELAKEYGW